jgi:tagatose-1,6-bisphosphate aldolase
VCTHCVVHKTLTLCILYYRPDNDLVSSNVARIKEIKSTSCFDGNLLFFLQMTQRDDTHKLEYYLFLSFLVQPFST